MSAQTVKFKVGALVVTITRLAPANYMAELVQDGRVQLLVGYRTLRAAIYDAVPYSSG